MKLYEKYFMTAVLGSLMILVESCSSSVLVDVWSDPSYHETSLKKIFVIAVRKDPVQRRIWEDAFTDELSKHGVVAAASYKLFPDALPDTSQVVGIVQEKGFDGIIITRVLRRETETRFVESYTSSEARTRYNPFRKVYSTYYEDVKHPGHYDSKIINRRAIEVWVIKDKEKLIWAATSNTPERTTVEDVQEDIAELVIPALRMKAIIK